MNKEVELLIREAFCRGAVAGAKRMGNKHEAPLNLMNTDDVFRFVQWDFTDYLRSLKGNLQEAQAYRDQAETAKRSELIKEEKMPKYSEVVQYVEQIMEEMEFQSVLSKDERENIKYAVMVDTMHNFKGHINPAHILKTFDIVKIYTYDI